jgi:hypothetical protein
MYCKNREKIVEMRRCRSSEGIIKEKPLTSRAGKMLHQEIKNIMAFNS